MANDAAQETPSQRTARRVGTCIAQHCRERCEVYTYNMYQDGFNICVCGHTQQSHAFGEDARP